MSPRRALLSLSNFFVGLSLLLVLAIGCGGAEPTPNVVAAPSNDGRDTVARVATDGTPEPGTAIPVTSADPQRGNPLAPVTLVIFGDFQCPFTARLVQLIPKLEQRYGDKLRIVWKNLPLPFHREARPAAIAAETVHRLGGDKAFWTFHALAFANQKSLSPESYLSWASQAGVDKGAFREAFDQQQYAAKIDADIAASKEAGATGTPASFLNGVSVSGAQPLEKFAEVIDAELPEAEAVAKSGVDPARIYAVRSEKNHKEAPPAKHEATPVEDNKTVWRVPIDGAPVKGKPTALVTLVMFGDFQCPFCGRVKPTLDALVTEYGDKLRVVMKQAPLPFHPRAEPAAELALEARAQKGDAGFWKAFDLLYKEQLHLSDQDLEVHAKALGLDVARTTAAIRAHKYAAVFAADEALAEDVQASGTPHFFINGRRLVGAQPAERFEQIIDEEIAKANALVKAGTPPTKIYDALQKDARGAQPFERVVVPAPTKANPSKGPLNAKVVVQMFSDFQCPFCKRVLPAIDELMAAYPGRIRIVWRHRPLAMHKQALLASEAAAEAFAQKGDAGFWKMADKLWEDQGAAGLERPALTKRAAELGLDMARFNAALDQHVHKAEIDADVELAEKAGLFGTPAFAVGDYFVSGAQPVVQFKRRVDKALGPHEPIAPGTLHVASPPAPPPTTAPPSLPSAPVAGKFGAKHILIMYVGSRRAPSTVTRTREQARALAAEVTKKARAGARFEDLAAQYSDEPGAAARGGDLGHFAKGAMLPEFEQGLEQLRVGDVSEPVETPFGFHVILRTP